MSDTMLAWGIDLGPSDSVAAKLFDDELPGDGTTWDLYCYGAGHDRLALLLTRSLVIKDPESKDYSVSDFIEVTMGADGFPKMVSQPTSAELTKLQYIVKQVRPDPKTVELLLQLLLLPGD